MNKRLTTLLLTFAIALTGIAPTGKAWAETAPEQTQAPVATVTPAETPKPTPYPGIQIGVTIISNGQRYINTEEGLKPYTDELYWSYRPTPVPTEAPKPTPEPGVKIGAIIISNGQRCINTEEGLKPYTNELYYSYKSNPTLLKVGTIQAGAVDSEDSKPCVVTKGIEGELSFCIDCNNGLAPEADGAKWTSSNPKVVSVKAVKAIKGSGNFRAKIKGKKCGKAVITAECVGHKNSANSIKVKVVKNEYKSKKVSGDVDKVTKLNLYRAEYRNSIAVQYNKKGGLTIKCTKISKWKNPKEKKIIRNLLGMHVKIIDGEFKKVVNCTVRCPKMTLSPKKSNAVITYTVPKKYLPKKKIDLRNCTYSVMTGPYDNLKRNSKFFI